MQRIILNSFQRYSVFKILLSMVAMTYFYQFYDDLDIHHKIFNFLYVHSFSDNLTSVNFFLAIKISLIIALLICIPFVLGFYEKTCSFLIWLALTGIAIIDPLIKNVSFNYLGWLFIAVIFIQKQKTIRVLQPILKESAWFTLGIGYTTSGLYKLTDPHWLDGSAIFYILQSVIGRNSGLVNVICNHALIPSFMTYFTVMMEILSLPLIFSKKGRVILLIGMTTIHLGIASLTLMTSLSLSILVFHFFLIIEKLDPEFKDLYKF